MTIAQQMKTHHNAIDDLEIECYDKAIRIEQDYDFDSTLYEFVDGSVIVVCNDGVTIYGCRN